MPIGSIPEVSSQQILVILVGIILVGRWGVRPTVETAMCTVKQVHPPTPVFEVRKLHRPHAQTAARTR